MSFAKGTRQCTIAICTQYTQIKYHQLSYISPFNRAHGESAGTTCTAFLLSPPASPLPCTIHTNELFNTQCSSLKIFNEPNDPGMQSSAAELLRRILQELDTKDLASAMLVSQQWKVRPAYGRGGSKTRSSVCAGYYPANFMSNYSFAQ
jgi:hypothetical protein